MKRALIGRPGILGRNITEDDIEVPTSEGHHLSALYSTPLQQGIMSLQRLTTQSLEKGQNSAANVFKGGFDEELKWC
jgi:transketolase N-terminal domain/subunit